MFSSKPENFHVDPLITSASIHCIQDQYYDCNELPIEKVENI